LKNLINEYKFKFKRRPTMKDIDTRSLFIGFLSATLIFTLMGAKQKKNLGDIVVNSITVMDDGYGGFITAYNQDQKRTLYLGTGEENNGYIQTFNKFQQPTAYVGTNKDMDGILVLNDRYGELGWSRSAKQ
tara:strand:+ start:1528 stop:1920 length:393 start_codon:yes stop_codon:yes gene_type:complete